VCNSRVCGLLFGRYAGFAITYIRESLGSNPPMGTKNYGRVVNW